MGGRSAATSIVAHLALLLAATLTACALLEATLRLLGVETAARHAIGGFTVYDPVLGWRLAPQRERIFEGAHFAVRVTHNPEGLRDRHYSHERVPRRRRILALGDSFVWCWGVAQPDCFTEIVERALADTDVINAGVPGYSTAQAMLFYEREGRRYRPDLVLLVLTPNDPADNVSDRLGPRFRLDGDRLVAPAGPARRRKGPLREWLHAHSKLFAEANYAVAVLRGAIERALGRLRSSARVREGTPGPRAGPRGRPRRRAATGVPRPDAAWLLTEALLDRLAAAVARDGSRLALVFEEMPRPMPAWARQTCAARGLPCLHLNPALDAARARGEKPRLQGDPHISPAGQRAVAAAVLQFLDREKLLPDGRP